MVASPLSQEGLSARAGITRRTLRLSLDGVHNFRLITLFAVTDKLGLQLLPLPCCAAAGLESGPPLVAS